MNPDDVAVPGCLPDHPVIRKDMCDYYFEVQRFDRNVGAMLEMLEERGELENTLVVVAGDNGLPFPRCKVELYDTGTKVPLAIRWGERIKGGRVVDDFVSLAELGPTFLEAAGTSKIAVVCLSLVASFVYISAGVVDWTYTVVLILGGSTGSFLGAHYGLKKGDEWVRKLFMVVVLVSAVRLLM